MKFNIFKRNNTQQEVPVCPQPQPEPARTKLFNGWNLGSLPFGYFASGGAMGLSGVFSAVEIISNSLAELPILVKQKEAEDCGTFIKDHYVYDLFDNMAMTKFIFIKKMVTDMLLEGNGYAYIKRGAEGKPTKIIYLQKGTVKLDEAYLIQTGDVRFNVASEHPFIPSTIYDRDIIHFYKNSYNGYEGRGILSYANRTIDLSNYTEEAAKDYFGSGCNIKGIIKMLGTTRPLTDDEKSQIRQNWQQVHGGAGSSGLAIMPTNLDFIPVSQNASESQMIETRTFNVQEIARYFNISPVMLQDLSHSSYSTIEASQLEFLTHTLLPYISMIEHELNRKLLMDKTEKIDLDENYLMTSDKSATANYLSTLVKNGIMCINEARYQLGFGPVEGGDKHIIAYSDPSQNSISNTEEKN